MVKNLNTIERSERIRIGKNVPDEQAINTVIINASNVSLNAPLSGLYVSPIRYDTSVLSNTLVYNTVTKEIVDAGISADNQTLQDVSDYGNTTTNTLEFNNPTTGFVSISNVGISNTSPIHTLDVGSNLYVSDTDSNVLTVLGSTYIEQNLVVDGNLTVRGDSTLVHSENLTISDPIIELGKNNTSTDFIFDLGIIMNRPGSNVTVGYIEDAEKLVLAYTDSSPSGRYIVPDSSNALSVQVYGNVTANAYFGLGTTLDGVALATDLESNVVRIEVLETDMASNTGRIEVLETDLASNTGRIEVLETDLASNTGRIEVLETDLASNTGRIEVLETDLASNTGRIEVLETDMASNTGRIEVLETDMASNTGRIEVLETDTASNTARIVVLETDLASNTGRIVVLETDLASNTGRIEVLETDMASNTGRIEVLETDTASNTARIEVLETDTASNTARIEVLETDMASNASRIGTLEGQIVTKAPINNPVFTGIITGNGGLISNVTLEQVVSYGNTTSNTLYLTNEDTSLVTEGSMGVGTTTPDKKLHVAGDVQVDANVYAVRYFGDGGLLSNTALTPTLQIVTQVGSTTDRTVKFTNVTTGFITTSNAVFGGNIYVTEEITVTGNVYAQKDLEVVGNVVTYKDLLVSGNVYVSQNVSVTEELTVSGNVYAQKDLEVVGNAYVSQNVSVTGELSVSGNVYADKDLEVIGNVVTYKDLLVSGNAYVSQNVSVTEELTVSGNVYAQKDLEVVGNAYVSQNVSVTEELTVSGNVYAQKDLEVVGNAYVSQNVSVTEELTVSGNVYADKDLEVIGNVYVDGNVVTYKDLLVSGNAYVSQNVSVTEELTVSGNVYAQKDLEVVGNVVAYGDILVSGNIYASQNVSVTEELTVSGNVYAQKDLEVVGNAYVSQNVSVTEELTVSGNVYAQKDLEVVGNAYVSQNVSVTEELTVSGNVYAQKDLEVVGNAYVSQNVSVTEELTVSGNVYADKDLEVIGNVYVDGNVVTYKDLLVSGNAYVSQNVSVTEELTISGNVYADKDLEVVGNVYVDGNVVAYKDLSVTGNAYVSGNVEVTESLIVSGNTHLEGDNVFVTHTMDFLDPTTAIVTDQVSNVQIRLGQLENVANTASNPLINQVLTYDQDNSVWSNAYPDQTIVQVKNTSGAPMTRGQAVHVTGSNGNNTFQIELADASDPTKMPAIGIVYEDIPINGQGAVVTFGRANGISGISGYTNGDTLYVASGTPGGLTNVKPYGVDLDLIQNVGVVVNNSGGVMFVTGIGRSNDIPNARIITDYNEMNYVYVNSENNDLKKITSANLNIPLTTAVSSSSNSAANAVTLRGVSITSGDGFHGDLVVAGNVTVDTNTFKVDAEANRVGILTTSPGQTLDVRGTANVGAFTSTSASVTDLTHSTSKDTGVLVVTQGGLGVEANIHSTNVFASSYLGVGTSATSNVLDVRGTANVGALVTTSTHISDSTSASSKTSGALQVTGGVGVQGDIHATNAVFDTIQDNDLSNKYIPYANASKVLKDSLIRQETNGEVIIATDLQITGNLLVQGNTSIVSANNLVVSDRIIDIANNNPEHDLDIGILMEHPGHNIGIIHHATDELTIGYTQNGYGDSHILRDYSNEFTVNVWGYVITQNTVTIEHNDLYVKDGLIGVSTSSPVANIHVVGNVFVTSNITTSSNILVNGDAAATSKTTGALQVVGGLGVQGDIYATHANLEDVEADSVTVTDTTTSTSTTTGALKVAGGVSTEEKLNVGGVTKIWDSTAVTGKTDGALVVVGGVGISGDIHATHANLEDVEADSVTVTDSTTSTSTTTGALKVTGGVSTQEKLNVGGVTKIWDSTAVTSKTDGALVVVGGVGISGDIHATHANLEDVEADSVTVTDSTTATDKTSGALVVTGGVGVSGALYGAAATFDGVTSVTNATAVTSKTDGALVVTGGVGISGDIHATHANLEDVEADSVTVTDATQATSTTTGALTVAGGISTQTNVHAANVYISGGLITNTAGVTKKTYAYSGTIADTEQPYINVCFTNESFSAKIDAQLIEGDDEISTISLVCCGGNKSGTFPTSDIQVGSVQVFGPASTNPWSSAVVADKTTVALRPSAAIDTSGEYHIFVEYLTAKTAGTVANVVQDTTEKIVFGY
jgi:cytoskeletal protein CcmA (bactofilin family)